MLTGAVKKTPEGAFCDSYIRAAEQQLRDVKCRIFALKIVCQRNGFTDSRRDTADAAVDGEGFTGTKLALSQPGVDCVDDAAVGDADDGPPSALLDHVVDGTEHTGCGCRNGFHIACLTFAAGEETSAFVQRKTCQTAVIPFHQIVYHNGVAKTQ